MGPSARLAGVLGSLVVLSACSSPEAAAAAESHRALAAADPPPTVAPVSRDRAGRESTDEAPSPAVAPTTFEIVLDRALPEELRWAADIRWASDDAVWLAAGRSGVFRLGLDADRPQRLTAGGEGSDGLQLAASDGIVAAAVGFGSVSWLDDGASALRGRAAPLSVIVDFDLRQGEVLLLGARRNAEGAVEDGILWSGTLRDSLEELRSTMEPEDPSALAVARCGILEIGAVRYLADGRHAVVPGFVPGAYLYDQRGLVRAWDTASLDIYDHCDIDWDTANLLMRDPEARMTWVHQRQVLDELLPWRGWPALLIRKPRADGTAWHLVVLSEVGISEPVDLPVTTSSIGSHVRGDVRGDRLALLISEFGPPEPRPAQPPRLVVLKIDSPTPAVQREEPDE